MALRYWSRLGETSGAFERGSAQGVAIREQKIHIVGSPELKIEARPSVWMSKVCLRGTLAQAQAADAN